MFRKFHCHTEMVHNVNWHMQYFPKENPVKFRNYHKITLNCTPKTCTIYCQLSIRPYRICRVIEPQSFQINLIKQNTDIIYTSTLVLTMDPLLGYLTHLYDVFVVYCVLEL